MNRYLEVFKQTGKEFVEDKVPRLGAALAYYTIFSIAPLLLIAIAIAGMILGEEAARGQVVDQLRGVMGPTTAKAIEEMVENAANPKSGAFATIVAILTLFLGASGVFGQLKDALNTIWDVEPKKGRGITGFIRQRFLSMAMVCGVAFLLLVSLLIDAAISALGARFLGDAAEAMAQSIQIVVSLGVVTVLFAMIFRLLPDLKIEWHDVWFGAAFTSVLFVIGKFALSLYLGKGTVGSAYGAAGSLVVLLVWIYYSAQIVLFGAEFTQVYARAHGSHSGETKTTEKEKERAADVPIAQPAAAPIPVTVKSGGGGGGLKLAAGGIAGLIVGALVGGIGATVVFFKSIKKLLIPKF